MPPATTRLVYGRKPVHEVLAAGKVLDKIYALHTLKSQGIPEIRQLARDLEVPIHWVTSDRLNQMVRGNHQGIVAWTALLPYYKLEDVIPTIYERGEVPLLLMLDHLTDVGNVGAIARTAWGAGAHALIVPARGSADINEDAMKTSAGALEHLPVCRFPGLIEAADLLQANGIAIAGASEKGDIPAFKADLTIPICLALGAEDKGISAPIRNRCDHLLQLPMARTFDSYNVSVAAGMLLYEVLRQRQG